jgi:hypothetical protein
LKKRTRKKNKKNEDQNWYKNKLKQTINDEIKKIKIKYIIIKKLKVKLDIMNK